jgi:hypothetical protein
VNRIFQIGFNKCGTSSLYRLFSEYTEPNIRSVHWDYGRLALSMYNNLKKGRPMLFDYQGFQFFSDMEAFVHDEKSWKYYYLFKNFDIIDTQYPNSKFILNTRPISRWITSRLNHINGYRIYENQIQAIENGGQTYMASCMDFYQTKDPSKILSIWTEEWQNHHERVREYFKDRPKDLLVFDIELDNVEKIKEFLPDITFTTESMPHTNRTNTVAS